MGQRLRVVGWLRFGNKAQLTKGLQAFAAREAPDYFEADQWEIDGLEARVHIDTELPGDFTDVAIPFAQIFGAAAIGYVDYFEDGDDKIAGAGKGRLKRWNHLKDQPRAKWPGSYGYLRLDYPEPSEPVIVGGSVTFADDKALANARALLPVRLPFLTADAVLEVRLDASAVRVEGSTLTLAAVVDGPARVLEYALAEALSALASKAASGALTVTSRGARLSVAPKGKLAVQDLGRTGSDVEIPPGAARIAPVDPATPLPASALPAGATAAKVGKAKAGAVIVDVPHPVIGATRLSTGEILVWDEYFHLSVLDDDLRVRHSFRVPRGAGIERVLDLGEGRAAVVQSSEATVPLLDVRAFTFEVVPNERGNLKGPVRAGDHLVCWSPFKGVATFSRAGAPQHRFAEREGIEAVVALDDATLVVAGQPGSDHWDLATGEKLRELPEATAAHALSGGRFLLEKYGEFTLHSPGPVRTFEIDRGNSHTVVTIDADRVLVFSRSGRRFFVVDLASAEQREHATGHTKDLGSVRRFDLPSGAGAVWVSHARSMPGLNERFGFDGALRFRALDTFEELGVLDLKAPVRSLVELGNGRVAVLFDDAQKGKTAAIVDVPTRKQVALLDGARKAVLGVIPLSGGRALWCSKDGKLRVAEVG